MMYHNPMILTTSGHDEVRRGTSVPHLVRESWRRTTPTCTCVKLPVTALSIHQLAKQEQRIYSSFL